MGKTILKVDNLKTKYITRFHDIPGYMNAADYAKELEASNNRYRTLMKELGIIK